MAGDTSSRKLFAGAGPAALRQGGKELGTALKALPDSIAVDEPGTVLSPTQGEIAEANRGGAVWGRVQDGRERAAARVKDVLEIGRERRGAAPPRGGARALSFLRMTDEKIHGRQS